MYFTIKWKEILKIKQCLKECETFTHRPYNGNISTTSKNTHLDRIRSVLRRWQPVLLIGHRSTEIKTASKDVYRKYSKKLPDHWFSTS